MQLRQPGFQTQKSGFPARSVRGYFGSSSGSNAGSGSSSAFASGFGSGSDFGSGLLKPKSAS
jgi:hypothetical protein